MSESPTPLYSTFFDRIPGLLGILVTNAEGALIDKALSPHLPSTLPLPLTAPSSSTTPNPSLTSLCASHLLSLEQSAKLGREYGRNRVIVAVYGVESQQNDSKFAIQGDECIVVQYVWRGVNQRRRNRQSVTQQSNNTTSASITQKFQEMMQQRDQLDLGMELEEEALLFTFIMGTVVVRQGKEDDSSRGGKGTVYAVPAVGLMRELAPQIAESFALAV